MQLSVPATVMRGGTSKGLFFLESDLPQNEAIRNEIILKAFGSPDPYGLQIDGLGGATSTTSKVALISKDPSEPNRVNYTFGQVDITTPLIDMKGNCGNISSAVGPFAIDHKLIDEVSSPVTKVTIFNTNTKKKIIAHVPTENGITLYDGTYKIAGVANSGSRIRLDFMDPGGSVTGKLLPTGKPKESLATLNYGNFDVSIVDAANPVVFVRAQDVGIGPSDWGLLNDDNKKMLEKLFEIRATACVHLGMASNLLEAYKSPAVPKICLVSKPLSYMTKDGTTISQDNHNIKASMVSMWKLHPTFPVTGGISLAVAIRIRGTVVNECGYDLKEDVDIKIGHPNGIMDVGSKVSYSSWGEPYAISGSIYRTSRQLMNGSVFCTVEEKVLRENIKDSNE